MEVLPALAGMSRFSFAFFGAVLSAPRASGDEPLSVSVLTLCPMCSPR